MNALDKPGLYFPGLIDSDLLLAGFIFMAILFLLIGIVNPIFILLIKPNRPRRIARPIYNSVRV